jgi:tripartite-type tricarboxylate transporter receptor subunit TctC
MTYVPFPGGTPAVNALLGGHVTAVLQNYIEVGEQIRSGTLRALATPSRQRIPPLPDLPTFAEAGYKDVLAEVWFGIVAPAKTPQSIIAQYIDWFRSAIEVPEVKAKLANQALYPRPLCGEDFAGHIRHQVEEFARVIAELKLKG